MATKAPDKLLTVAELCFYTGFEKKKVQRMMVDPKVWAKPGGAKLVEGDYRLPLSFYNAWVDSKDVALAPAKKEELAHA